MPLEIKGKTYTAPSENGTPGFTGREMVEIEDYFKLDAMSLMSTLAGNERMVAQGYTRTKAIFALAWVTLSRAGEPYSLSDVLDELSLSDINIVDTDDDEAEQGKDEAPDSSEELSAAE